MAVGVYPGVRHFSAIFNTYFTVGFILFTQVFAVDLVLAWHTDLMTAYLISVSCEDFYKCDLYQHADDCVLIAHSSADLEEALNCLLDALSALRIAINADKTKLRVVVFPLSTR